VLVRILIINRIHRFIDHHNETFIILVLLSESFRVREGLELHNHWWLFIILLFLQLFDNLTEEIYPEVLKEIFEEIIPFEIAPAVPVVPVVPAVVLIVVVVVVLLSKVTPAIIGRGVAITPSGTGKDDVPKRIRSQIRIFWAGSGQKFTVFLWFGHGRSGHQRYRKCNDDDGVDERPTRRRGTRSSSTIDLHGQCSMLPDNYLLFRRNNLRSLQINGNSSSKIHSIGLPYM